MSRDKQIEINRLAKELCHAPHCHIKEEPTECYHGCRAYVYAKRVIELDCHKASDVAEEIFEEIEEGIKAAVSALQFENNPIHRQVKHETYSSMMRFIKTIQEKHTEEWK